MRALADVQRADEKATFLVNETAKSALQIFNLWLAFEWIALSLKQQGPNPK